VRSRRTATAAPAAPSTPSPFELARSELRALPAPDDEDDDARLYYYTALCAILRRFASGHHGILAEVRTSEELLAVTSHGAEPLRGCLSACDLVKFAASRPSAAAHEQAREQAARYLSAVEEGR
ncbi:MAG: hypothetical protein KDC98_20770, partial [Planctomycetes bacterium]|nr:hypothetical protein [Planctomycetota bacterium]